MQKLHLKLNDFSINIIVEKKEKKDGTINLTIKTN